MLCHQPKYMNKETVVKYSTRDFLSHPSNMSASGTRQKHPKLRVGFTSVKVEDFKPSV